MPHVFKNEKSLFPSIFLHGEPGLRLQLGVVFKLFIEIVQIGPSVDGDVLDMS